MLTVVLLKYLRSKEDQREHLLYLISVEKLQNRHTIWESSNNILTTLKEDLEFSQLGIAQKEIILSLKQRLEPGQNISIKAFLTDDRDCSGRSVEQLLYGKSR